MSTNRKLGELLKELEKCSETEPCLSLCTAIEFICEDMDWTAMHITAHGRAMLKELSLVLDRKETQ